MELTKKLLTELQNRLKVGSKRGVHLNAVPGNSMYKFDLQRLAHINKNIPNDFINALLTEQPLKFKISWKENISDLNSLIEEEQVQLVKITKSFENLINQTETIESEKGINTFGFGFPLLIRRDQADNNLTVAPILIWSLRIKRSKEFNTWIINRNEDDPIYLNELLINHLQNDSKTGIDPISSDMMDDGLIDRQELLDICFKLISSINTSLTDNLRESFSQKLGKIKAISDKKHYESLPLSSTNSLIDFCGLFSIFEVQKQSIINEYDDLMNIEGMSIDLHNIENQLFQPISSIETDPSQQSILNSLQTIRNILIQGPPGTGKSQSLTAVLINALENHKKTIVVCEKNTALEVLYNAIKERGLSSNCIVIKDIVKDRRSVVDSVRNRIDDSSYRSQEYGFSIAPLANLTWKASELISAINKKHKNVGEKILDNNNWTNSVGLLLSEIKDVNEDFELNIDKTKFKFNTKELNALVDIAVKGKVLYDRYSANESKSFINPSKYNGSNPYILEQKIKEDFVFYESELWGENSVIRKISEEYLENHYFFDFKATKRLSYQIASWFSKSKRKILTDQKIIFKFSRQLQERVKQDDWVKKQINDRDCQLIINEIRDLIKIKEDYFNHDTDLFTKEFEWFKFYNDLPDLGKRIVDKLKTKKDWRKVLTVYYLNSLLIHNANKELPTNDDDLKELVESLSKIGKKQLKYVKEFWYSKQIDATRNFYLKNSELSVENLYNKRSSQRYKRLSLRQIVKYDPELFTTYFPVILTTPDVCSNLFKGMNNYFDIVLFDEASQLRLEDNLPALLKGKQIIIAGDEHQMPPSNYFSKVFDGIIEDEEDIEEDEEAKTIRDNNLLSCESLLDFAEDLNFEKRYLDFHYRSKHPYLIDFSNHAFYNRRLKPLPNNFEYVPIKYLQVNGTFSDHCNEAEAEAVLSIIENNIHRLPSGKYPSVGIATFNIFHRNLIQSKIRERQKFERYADFNQKIVELEDNGLFIKNLENIQGDERDVIILSTTYGINKEGKFQHHFGPINFKKGYKLLNVIITRAKYKVYVCTSVPEEVILNYKEYLVVENSNNKRAVLFAYLAYAKAVSDENNESRQAVLNSLIENSNTTAKIDNLNSELESPFEEEVYSVLLDNFDKKKIIPQFKFAEFRIDLVYDPQKEGLPKIAIECDGAAYHSSNEAYLYDHHRQKILESHGFVFHRIWSTNWWRNPKRETKALVEFIKKIEIQRPVIIKPDSAIALAFTDNFSRKIENSSIGYENLGIKNNHFPKVSQLNKIKVESKLLNSKAWESETCYWSSSELPGYTYAPNIKAWYKKKEVERKNESVISRVSTIAERMGNPENLLKVNIGSIVRVKYLNTGNIFQFQLVDSEFFKHEVTAGIQKINIKSPLAISLRGKSVGDLVKVGSLDTFYEILEINS